MFNNENERKPVPVRLALSDGRQIEGTLMLPMSVDIKRLLNSDGASVEFVSDAGVRSLVTKSAIIEIMLAESTETRPRAAGEADTRAMASANPA